MKRLFSGYSLICSVSLFICAFGFNSGNGVSSAIFQEGGSTFKEVNQIFRENCIECHSGEDAPNGLHLTSYSEAMNGSENGKVIIPGNPDASELVKRIKGISKPKMPLGRDRLNEEKINAIVEWIKAGAEDSKEITELTIADPIKDPDKDVILFSDVSGIFNRYCIECHMENGKMGSAPEGFLLTSYKEFFNGDERIRVVPGNPPASELVRRIKGQSLPQMPFDGPPFLDPEDIKLIEAWILQGAKDENEKKAPSVTGRKIRLQGILNEEWKFDDVPFQITASARIDKKVRPGVMVEVRGTLGDNNEIIVERIKEE